MAMFNENVALRVRDAVIQAAIRSSVARRIPPEFRVKAQSLA